MSTIHGSHPPQQYHRPVDDIGASWYWMAVLIPMIGFILGTIALSRDRVGPGLALYACTTMSWVAATVLFWIVVGTSVSAA